MTDKHSRATSTDQTNATLADSDGHLVEETNATEKEPSPLLDLQNEATQLKGWRLYSVIAGIGIGIFLVQLEITIVSTSLVSITTDLAGFQDVSWIVTAYLITYSGCLTILSKLSDIFGRRSLTATSYIIYIAFSVGCGFSDSIPTLIILRAFQGIGAGGIFALSYVILPEIVPPRQYSGFAAYIGAVAAIASLLGPLVGGAISNSSQSSWRWIFFLNGPVGLPALCFMLFGLPRYFPFHKARLGPVSNLNQTQSMSQKIRRIDFVGAFFLLGGSVLLIAGLEEGATKYSWTDALPITLVVLSVVMWICLIFWSRFSNQRSTRTESMFPWPMLLNRFTMGGLTSLFFSSAVLITLIISLPQRFQIVHGSSPFLSGIYILPLTISMPLGAMLTGTFITKLRVPPLYVNLSSAIMQLIGLALLGGQSVTNGIPAAVYGLQVLTGFGLGLNLTTSTLLVPMSARKDYYAVALGSIGQFRNLGGSVVLAILASVLNSSIQNELSAVLSPSQLGAVLQYPESIASLPGQVQEQVIDAYEDAYRLQLRVLLAFSCAVVLSTCIIFEKRPRHQNDKGELVS